MYIDGRSSNSGVRVRSSPSITAAICSGRQYSPGAGASIGVGLRSPSGNVIGGNPKNHCPGRVCSAIHRYTSAFSRSGTTARPEGSSTRYVW